jgi:YfiH family protein
MFPLVDMSQAHDQGAASPEPNRLMNLPMTMAVRPITSERLTAIDGIRHGFFTREGGVSSGIYSGLNVGLGSDDDRDTVMQNRARVAAWLGAPGSELSTPHQIHSADVLTIDRPLDMAQRPRADAVVTAEPGVIIGILTADCGPVLFADAAAGVIGAAHAGWKGAIGGILENTVDAMVARGARRENIRATLGPAISRRNYEVGQEFIDRFTADDAGNAEFFEPSARNGHFMFDLPDYILKRLDASGIAADMRPECTYEHDDRFYSYRRTTHRSEPDYGRQISAIMLKS